MEVQGTPPKARVTWSPQVAAAIKVLLSKNSFKDVTPKKKSTAQATGIGSFWNPQKDCILFLFIDFVDYLSVLLIQFSNNLEIISSMHAKKSRDSYLQRIITQRSLIAASLQQVHLRDNRSIPPVSPARAMNLLAHLLKFVYEAIPC